MFWKNFVIVDYNTNNVESGDIVVCKDSPVLIIEALLPGKLSSIDNPLSFIIIKRSDQNNENEQLAIKYNLCAIEQNVEWLANSVWNKDILRVIEACDVFYRKYLQSKNPN